MNVKEASIYVGTYAKYNDGNIEGDWLDLNDYADKEEFIEACLQLHNDEEDPELMFQDWENIPECCISESWISEKFWEIMDAVEEDQQEAFFTYVDYMGFSLVEDDIDELISKFDDAYRGEYESEVDYAEELFDECYAHDIPESLRGYIDYESFSRDLFMDGYSFQGGHVFTTY